MEVSEENTEPSDEMIEYNSPEQLSEELVTLSLLPESRWKNLLHLDVIKVIFRVHTIVSFKHTFFNHFFFNQRPLGEAVSQQTQWYLIACISFSMVCIKIFSISFESTLQMCMWQKYSLRLQCRSFKNYIFLSPV